MLKIALIGPESTGKTELSKRLAEYYHALWIPEYAREYFSNKPTGYTFEDVCNIAHKQVEQEQYYADFNNEVLDFVFFDTELIITKVWFEYCYKTVPDFVEDQLQKKFFDLYLLCAPDLPWEPDPLREHGDDRLFFFNWYKSEIEKLGKPYNVITGIGEERFKNAIRALGSFKEKMKINKCYF